jgi:hypothetical protein
VVHPICGSRKQVASDSCTVLHVSDLAGHFEMAAVRDTPNSDSPMGMAIRYGEFTHEVCFNPDSLSRLMRLAGFEAIEARETGPVPWGYGLKSTLRARVWPCIRAALGAWNIAEVGHVGHGAFSRVFLMTGVRR